MSKTPDRSERRKQRLEVVYRAIDELKPDPANARQHSHAQIRKLANSIVGPEPVCQVREICRLSALDDRNGAED
jgi:hypothetical protein